MSLQVHCYRTESSVAATGTAYLPLVNAQHLATADEYAGAGIIAAPGTLSNVRITLTAAPGAGRSRTFTLVQNGSDTGVVIAIADAATVGEYTGAPVALAAGDTLTFRQVPASSPASTQVHLSWDFTSTVPGESIYGLTSTQVQLAISRENDLLFGSDATNWSANDQVPCPLIGTITRLYVRTNTSTGGSGSYEFAIYKNGVKQDGAGGTADTRILFDNGTGAGLQMATFTLPVAIGDVLRLQATETGSAATLRAHYACNFLTDTFGYSIMGGAPGTSASTSATTYYRVSQGAGATTFTEADAVVNVGLTGFTLRNLRARVNLDPSGTYTFNLRKNAGSASHSCAIVGPSTTAVASAATVFAAGDTMTLEIVPSDTPSVRATGWAVIQDQAGAEPPRLSWVYRGHTETLR